MSQSQTDHEGSVPRPLNVVFVTPDMADNSLGRTYCLWQLAEALGWKSTIVSTLGYAVWGPLAGSPMSADCLMAPEDQLESLPALLNADVVIAVKPVDDSFGVALKLTRRLNLPLLLDIDDPDLEAQLSWDKPLRRLAKSVLRRTSVAATKRLLAAATTVPTIVSNPVLQESYGGPIVPHIRDDPGTGNPHTSWTPRVAFVGSDRSHKGLRELREAVARTQDLGYTLIVTDTAEGAVPAWEEWVGSTSMESGLDIVATSDVVVLPSLDVAFARGQLPAKLMDAMLLGRAIAVSNIEPMPWALAGNGRVITPGSVDAIETVLREFADPAVRTKVGEGARAQALRTFVAGPNLHAFDTAVRDAIAAASVLTK